MPKRNPWGEPVPERLKGALGRAWDRILVANEWFDGEDGIAYGHQQRLIREWRENKPSTVVMYSYSTRETVVKTFETRQRAEAYAEAVTRRFDTVLVTVRPANL
jgi:hypothetical protein